MNRSKSSWKRVVLVLLISIFLCAAISLYATAVSSQNRMQERFENENDFFCGQWVESIDLRLTTVQDNLRSIYLQLYTPDSFWNMLEKEAALAELDSLLQNTANNTNDISALFFYDLSDDTYLFKTSFKSNIKKLPMAKSFIEEECKKNNQSLSDYVWTIKQIGGQYYFFKALIMDDYIIGAVSECMLYAFDVNFGSSLPTFMISDGITTISGHKNENVRLLEEYESSKDVYLASSVQTGEYTRIEGTINTVMPTEGLGQDIGFLLVLNGAIGIILVVVLSAYMRDRIAKPTKELIRATQEVSRGNLDYRMNTDKSGSVEFEELYTNFNRMTEQIENLKISEYDNLLREEENKLRMMRSQLRPHTFLNGITTISNLTYDNDMEKVREYIYQFSRFTRYMLNTSHAFATVKEELGQINSYVQMQKIKFPNSIEYTYEAEESVMNVQIPYLLLFSLVENSFKHAMNLIKTVHIDIRCERYEEEGFKGIRLIEEDDGDGFTEEAFERISQMDDEFAKEHIGLTNVKYTLHLLYKREDLLRISNKESGGARVEILIPENEAVE